MNIKWILLSTFWVSFSCFGQNLPEKKTGENLSLKATALIGQNKYSEAIELLKEAKKLEPDNIVYPYEIALAHYHLRSYKPAIKILKKLTKHDECSPAIYQLLGNCFDNMGLSKEAIEIYDKGLEIYPEAGSLYLEKGIVEFTIKNYDEAIAQWEKGVEMDPSFSSNYYWLGKIFAVTKDKVWASIYAEMFMNIERNSARTVEMSRILYKVYDDVINNSLNDQGKISFSREINPDHEKGLKTSFPNIFSGIMNLGLPTEQISSQERLSLSSINILRQNFLNKWFEENKDHEYPNILFDFLNILKSKGFLECYNYWFLMMGEEDEFGFWYEENRSKYQEFTAWFNKNPLVLDRNTFFVRQQY